jgi:hypothetical protein
MSTTAGDPTCCTSDTVNWTYAYQTSHRLVKRVIEEEYDGSGRLIKKVIKDEYENVPAIDNPYNPWIYPSYPWVSPTWLTYPTITYTVEG